MDFVAPSVAIQSRQPPLLGGLSASSSSGEIAMTPERNWKLFEGSVRLSHVPRKIRQLVSDLERSGFSRIHGGKGSHRKFMHPKFRGFVLISGHDGDDAQHYQEKQVRNAVKQVQ
jgi:predicted RNA binding protein YcfA (HicA-like mRNA interferase family)